MEWLVFFVLFSMCSLVYAVVYSGGKHLLNKLDESGALPANSISTKKVDGSPKLNNHIKSIAAFVGFGAHEIAKKITMKISTDQIMTALPTNVPGETPIASKV